MDCYIINNNTIDQYKGLDLTIVSHGKNIKLDGGRLYVGDVAEELKDIEKKMFEFFNQGSHPLKLRTSVIENLETLCVHYSPEGCANKPLKTCGQLFILETSPSGQSVVRDATVRPLKLHLDRLTKVIVTFDGFETFPTHVTRKGVVIRDDYEAIPVWTIQAVTVSHLTDLEGFDL